MMEDLPVKALSIMQPWAWLIVNRHKAIENRDWPTRFRGPVAIHAGKKMDHEADHDVQTRTHPVTGGYLDVTLTEAGRGMGGIVGVADIVDCVERDKGRAFIELILNTPVPVAKFVDTRFES
jgi:hypothetical protein